MLPLRCTITSVKSKTEKSKLYTRTGDSGETSLFGGTRVKKNHTSIRAIGVIDELNASIGVALSFSKNPKIGSEVGKIQAVLFEIGANLAGSKQQIAENEIGLLESLIDQFDSQLTPLRNFILPGGNQAAALWHQARTICRRSERTVVTLVKKETVDPVILRYLNRLADLLFVFARIENDFGKKDVIWQTK